MQRLCRVASHSFSPLEFRVLVTFSVTAVCYLFVPVLGKFEYSSSPTRNLLAVKRGKPKKVCVVIGCLGSSLFIYSVSRTPKKRGKKREKKKKKKKKKERG